MRENSTSGKQPSKNALLQLDYHQLFFDKEWELQGLLEEAEERGDVTEQLRLSKQIELLLEKHILYIDKNFNQWKT